MGAENTVTSRLFRSPDGAAARMSGLIAAKQDECFEGTGFSQGRDAPMYLTNLYLAVQLDPDPHQRGLAAVQLEAYWDSRTSA